MYNPDQSKGSIRRKPVPVPGTAQSSAPTNVLPATTATATAVIRPPTFNENVPPRRPVPVKSATAPAQSGGRAKARVSDIDEEEQLVEKARELQLEELEDLTLAESFHDGDSLTLVQSPSTLSETTTATTESSSGASVSASTSSSLTSTSKDRSIWRTAWEETRHFAGGLISHPSESTKHYSILRHSHGLVWYKGPTTNVAITIFSDRPLPEDRRIWMQRKGFSGSTGMNIKAFFRGNSTWIDVTPAQKIEASQLPPNDERAWQRDIKRFLKKAHKSIQSHVPCETHVLRIPTTAEDGYFRVVLCSGHRSKTVLCPSPVFRVASTSTDISILRGASLATLPVEVGLKVASMVGKNYAAASVVSPVTSVIQNQLSPYQSQLQAAALAYEISGAQDKLDSKLESYQQQQSSSSSPAAATGREQQLPSPPPPAYSQLEQQPNFTADPLTPIEPLILGPD